MKKSIVLFLLILNTLFAFSKIDEQRIFRFEITDKKEAKELFLFLQKLDLKAKLPEDWEIKTEKKEFIYSYFDTNNLKLYKNKTKAVLILDESKKEFILFDDTVFETKKYKKQKSLEEKHPLFGLIKRSKREEFSNILKKNRIDSPLKLKNLFNLIKLNWDILISKDNLTYAIITLQKNTLKDFAFKPDYYQIIFLIKNRDQINQADYKFLNQIANDLKNRLQKKFLFLKESECRNDYICDFNYFKDKVPFFEFAVKYPLFYYIVYIMSFGMIGGLIAVILKNFLTKR